MEDVGRGVPPEAKIEWRVGRGGGVYASKGARARELRQQATPAEVRFWSLVRSNRVGVKFRRQHQIGPYIVDFCALSARVIVELLGSAHDSEEARAYDARRKTFLEEAGFLVVEFSNEEVLGDPYAVEASLRSTLTAAPSPTGKGALQTR